MTQAKLKHSSIAKPDHTMTGVLIFITLVGLAIRLAPALQSEFPLNDGGLFYAMITDLERANFVLPAFATYNGVAIPFAYPPLGFYLAGLLSKLLNLSVLDLLRILPAIISTLSIPAFYLLAKRISASDAQAALSVFAFSLIPRAFEWHIMGGGITRALGLLCALLTMTCAYDFFGRHKLRSFLLTLGCGTLVVLTHPEAATHTAVSALVFYIWKDRSKKGLLYAAGIATGILILTAPWWSAVVARNGLDPFQAAMTASKQDSYSPFTGLFIFFRFVFTDEPFLPLWATLGLVGLFANLARKQTFLPAWLFILHLVEPRGGGLYMMIPLALLGGSGLEHIILQINPPNNIESNASSHRPALEKILTRQAARYLILFLFVYGTMAAFVTSEKIQNDLTLKPPDLEAFAWVRQNTPPDSSFVLLTNAQPLRDAVSEWFPVLAERRSQTTVFGYEWVLDGRFKARVDSYNSLQTCLEQNVRCLETWRQQTGSNFSYIYIWDQTGPGRYALGIYLEAHPAYALVFQNERVMIFKRSAGY